jgi:hypothetical protein
MGREDIIRMAREAGLPYIYQTGEVANLRLVERFAALVADAERNKLAAWMIERGYATGHGDTVEDLLKELEWQIEERTRNEREACAKACEILEAKDDSFYAEFSRAKDCAAAIRART